MLGAILTGAMGLAGSFRSPALRPCQEKKEEYTAPSAPDLRPHPQTGDSWWCWQPRKAAKCFGRRCPPSGTSWPAAEPGFPFNGILELLSPAGLALLNNPVDHIGPVADLPVAAGALGHNLSPGSSARTAETVVVPMSMAAAYMPVSAGPVRSKTTNRSSSSRPLTQTRKSY